MKILQQTQAKSLPSLSFCITMDLIGYASFSIPFIGEFSDVIWAPLSAFIFMRSFGGRFGAIGSVLNFLEEALPFTDIIPSFTISYFLKKHFMDKQPTLRVN